MPRPHAIFKQGDLTRAIKGIEAAGKQIRSVVIDKTGAIRVEVGGEAATEAAPLDTWMQGRAHQA